MKLVFPATVFARSTRVALAALALSACTASAPEGAPGETVASAQVEASESAIAIEEAERMLERGQSAAEAKKKLDEALAAADITPEERSRGILALSRAHEALGNAEQAIALVEAELAAHSDDPHWPSKPFEKRLLVLLTGEDSMQGLPPEPDDTAANFAHVAARYFPPNAEGKVFAKFVMTAPNEVSDELGTFDIGAARRAELRESCPLCEHDINTSVHVGRSNWLILASHADELDEAMVVVYFDLGVNRVPARYERYLPMKVAEVEAQLAAGKSFVVAKERPGAPPLLLLAAPRSAMLPDVEATLASLDELPVEPVYVDVSTDLRPREIRAVVRHRWRPHFKACYESLLEKTPDAGGTMRAFLEIAGDGTVVGARFESDEPALEDADFVACVSDSARATKFPATGRGVKVTYPFTLKP